MDSGYAFLSPYDADRNIEDFKLLEMSQFGSSCWWTQHHVLDLLNLQTHHCVQNHADNFISESFITNTTSLTSLITQLFLYEAYSMHAIPILSNTIIEQWHTRLYFIVRHYLNLKS